MINDADKSVQELLDEYKPLKVHWKWVDLALGAVLGLYQPYMQRARDYDCQSEFFAFSFEIIDWYMLTDPYWWRGFDDIYSLVNLVGNAANQLGLLWRVVDTCAA